MPATQHLKTPDAATMAADTNSVSDADEEPAKGRRSRGSYKIQIHLTERQKARLFDLRDQTDAESATQVVRDALKIYEYVVEKTVQGNSKLFFQDQDTLEITELLI